MLQQSVSRFHGRVMFAATIMFALAGASQAAVVTWGPATQISGNSDVSTDGAAFSVTGPANVGGPGTTSTTINGVTFTATTTGSGVTTLGSGAGTFASLSAPYQELLSTGLQLAGTLNINYNNLTLGQEYEFEGWSNNSSSSTPQTTTVSIEGIGVTLSSNTTSVVGGVGQYVIGTFVADTTAETVTYTGGVANGFQLRVVPEPGAALLLALGACCSGLFRRRRRGVARV